MECRPGASFFFESGRKNSAQTFTELFDANQLISQSQFGFRKGFSTESALLVQKEIILKNIENKLSTLGIFLVFSKAFDCLDHGGRIGEVANRVPQAHRRTSRVYTAVARWQ